MKKLKEVVDKQRDEIRAKDRELALKNDDIEAVSVATFWRLAVIKKKKKNTDRIQEFSSVPGLSSGRPGDTVALYIYI